VFGRPLFLVLLLILVALLVWLRQPAADSQISRTALVMGTLVEIKVYSDDRKHAELGIDVAFAEMTRLEQLFSTHIPTSEISLLSAAERSMTVSSETASLLRLGQEIARRSAGSFDMTLGALKDLWRIESENPRIPAESAIKAALIGIGPDALQIDGRQVRKRVSSLKIDLGGIAKGYAVDRAVEKLRQSGIRSAAVNAGGDIRLLGDRQEKPWRIGIQDPRQSGEIIATLNLKNHSVVTSGDYERYFEKDGVRYHHLFNPQTGQPARECQSVTVVAADVATADALATAAFVLGPQQGLVLLEQTENVEGLLVAADGQRLATRGLEGLLEWH